MGARREDPAIDEAAATLLQRLDVQESPLTPQIVLDGLEIGLDTLPSFDLDRLTPYQRQTFSSVRGLLSLPESKIYLSPSLPERQEPWVIYHESGHSELTWHRELLYLDTAYTLSPEVRQMMEREANWFAGHLQFFGSQFAADARELPFGIAAARELSTRYGASLESSLRRYVETSHDQCLCAVFKVQSRSGETTKDLKFQYFTKPIATNTRWDFQYSVGSTLPPDDYLVTLFNDGNPSMGTIHQNTYFSEKNKIAYLQEIFCTNHAVYMLVRKL